jgi:Flp pilus assembly protein TadG
MSKWRTSIRRLLADESGAVVVWTTVGLFGFLAMGTLLLDGGRILNLHTQMQSYADHAALAAAAELDGDSNAIARAITAATGGAAGPIVTDTQNYAFVADKSLTVTRMTFLSKLGSGQDRAGEFVAGDVVEYTHTVGSALPAAVTLAPLSRKSRYVQVVVEPRDVTFVMAPVLTALGIDSANASGKSAVSAGAIAGFTRVACRFPPLMMCNPTESTAPGGGGPFDWESMIGKQVLLKSQSGGDQWAPGNYGLLDLTESINSTECTGGGGNFIRCVLALADPGTQCVLQDAAVDLKPGNTVGPTQTGFNTRFDVWDPPMQNSSGNAAFAPARNVIKGKTHDAGKCRESDLKDTSAPSVPLPRDAGISDSARIGNGITLADLQTYWTTNHPTVAWPFASGVKPTRYGIYRKEIELNAPVVPNEVMGPTCATPVSEPSDMDMVKDRRVMVIAVINCKENNIRGARDGVPVENFAVMFLTEPVFQEGSGVNADSGIYGEMLGIVKANTENGVLHEFPVLYR